MVGFRLFIQGKVADGQLDAFRDLAGRMTGYVRENEAGTEIYVWYLSDDGKFMNEDGYADDAALLTHLGNAGEQGFLDEYMALVEIEDVRVLGDSGDAAREALAGFGAVHYGMFEGF